MLIEMFKKEVKCEKTRSNCFTDFPYPTTATSYPRLQANFNFTGGIAF